MPVSTVPRSPGKHALLAVGVLWVVVIVAYLPSLDGGFLWDDQPLILQDPRAHSLGRALTSFVSPFWAGAPDRAASYGFYRPLIILSYAAEHAVHGSNATGFHATNILLQALNASLLLVLLRREGSGVVLPAALAGAWALLPRLSECVAWISGRTDVIAATFCLSALLVVEKRSDGASGSPGRRCVAAGLLLLGLFSKEVTLAAMAALAAEDLADRAVPSRKRALAAAFWATPLLVYLPFRRISLGAMSTSGVEQAPGLRLVTLPLEALGRYVVDVAVPWFPRTQQGTVWTGVPAYEVVGVLAFVASLVVLARPAGRALLRTYAGPVILVAASIGLVLHIVPLAADVAAADRYVYFPTIGLAWGLARWAGRATPNGAPLRKRMTGAALLLAASSAPFTFRRAEVWADEVAFWVEMRAQNPKLARPALHLGNVAGRSSFFTIARQLQEEALPLTQSRQGYGLALITLGTSVAALGEYDEAVRCAKALVAYQPQLAGPHLFLAYALVHRRDFEDARRELTTALAMHSPYPEATDLLDRLESFAVQAETLDHARTKDEAEVPFLELQRARLDEALGRRTEAVARWSRLVGDGRLPPAVRIEGAIYLVERAGLHAARTAAEAVRPFAPPAVTDALNRQILERARLRARLVAAVGAVAGS